MTIPLAIALADWAVTLRPTRHDEALARRALLDTVAVTVAGRRHHVAALTRDCSEAVRLGAVGHVLDFDDLHLESTCHISVVCVPATLVAVGDARAYLAGAGVMARLGMALGWQHYDAGWHITSTTGAVAASVAVSVARGLDAHRTATAIALAVPASGGVQRAFGTDAKSLQVGFAVDAGVRAAALAEAGAAADVRALDDWLALMGSAGVQPAALDGPAVPGGLAIKLYPACYALQRPISCLAQLRRDGLRADDVDEIVMRTPSATVAPLIHHRPWTGLEGKFSLEYAAAAALLDEHPGFESFTDDAVRRPQAQDLLRRVRVVPTPGGDWLLDGELEVLVTTRDGRRVLASQQFPPGSPARPPSPQQLEAKLADCLAGTGLDTGSLGWHDALSMLRDQLPTAGTSRRAGPPAGRDADQRPDTAQEDRHARTA